MKTFSKDDRLGYAINYAIDGLEQTVKILPKGATEAEIRDAMRSTKIYIGTLMSEVKKLDDELDDKPINLANFAKEFFERRRAI